MRRLSILTVVLLLPGMVHCQGAPRLGWTPDDRVAPGNHMAVAHGRVNIDLNANETLIATGVEASKTGLFSGTFKAHSLKIVRADVTPYWGGIIGGMGAYNAEEHTFFTEGIPAYAQAAHVILGDVIGIINAAAPMVGQWLSGGFSVAMAKQVRPSVVSQLAGAIGQGVFGPTVASKIGQVDPQLLQDALDALHKNMQPATAPAPLTTPSANTPATLSIEKLPAKYAASEPLFDDAALVRLDQ